MRARWVVTLIVLIAGLAWLMSSRREASRNDTTRTDHDGAQTGAPTLKGRGSETKAESEAPTDEDDATESPAPSIAIHVLWPDGKVDGRTAEVTMRTEDDRVWRATTDARGAVRFENLPPEGVRIDARAGSALHGTTFASLGWGIETWGYVHLDRDIRVRGRVLARASGLPVRGAHVYAIKGQDTWCTLRAGLPHALTDADGRYVLACPPPSRPGIDDWERYTLVALAPGHEAALHAFPAVHGLATAFSLDFTLEPGGTARGVVRDPAGAPVPRAHVAILPQGDAEARRDPWGEVESAWDAARVLTAKTDNAGQYAIDGLAFDAVYVATAQKPGFARSVDLEEITATAGKPEVSADLELRESCTLLLQVRDASGAETEYQAWLDERASRYARSDGRLRWDDLTPGLHRLNVCAHDGAALIETDVDVGRGGPYKHEIRLPPLAAISGVLVDPAGRPVTDRAVHLVAEMLPFEDDAAHALPEKDGAFSLTGLAPGPHRLRARWGPGWCETGEGLEVTAPAENVRFVVARPGLLLLAPRFSKADWAPAVYAWSPDGEPGRFGMAPRPANGVYRFHVVPGTADWVFGCDDHAPVRRRVRVASGQEVTIDDVAFTAGRTVSGRVVDDAGEPVVGATVRATDHLGDAATTSRDGSFRLEHLWQQDVTLRIDAEGYVRNERIVGAGALGPVRVVLTDRGAVVAARILDERGRGLAGETAYLHREGTPRMGRSVWSADSDAKGRIAYRVPAGRYQLSVKRERRHVVLATVEAEEGKRVEVELVVPPR